MNQKKEDKKLFKEWLGRALNTNDFDLEKEQKILSDMKIILVPKWYDYIPLIGFLLYVNRWTSKMTRDVDLNQNIIKKHYFFKSNYYQRKSIFSYNFYYKFQKKVLFSLYFFIPWIILLILWLIFPWLQWIWFRKVIEQSQEDINSFKKQK